MIIESKDKISLYKLLILQKEDEKDNLAWDNFVNVHADATVYHLSDWLNILQKESGQEVLMLVCKDEEGDIVGILPLQYTRGFPFGLGGVPGIKRLSSLPRTPIGGPLALDEKISHLLLQKAIDIVKGDEQRYLQIKTFLPQIDADPDTLTKYLWREIYITEIQGYPEEIRFGDSRNHAAIKRAVKKAIKNNVRFREADRIEELKEWYPLYLDTMRFHVTPARSYSFFKNIWERMKPKGLMSLVLSELELDKSKKIIAGSILFKFNDTITYAFNGSSREHFELRPNDLLHWEAIHNGQKEGFKYYDLGEVSKDHLSLAAYKKKWASTIKEMYHYYYPKPDKLDSEEELDAGTSGNLKQKVWQSLPLKITQIIGEKTYKYL
jgi:Acetyltransferase (GNAT) domain